MPSPISGPTYLAKLLKYLSTHKARLAAPPYPDAAPSPAAAGSFWEQTYTIATLGLDPTSAPLNGTLAQVFSLGLTGAAGAPAAAQRQAQGPTTKPLTLRLPPDRILFLLLMFQASNHPALASSPLIRPTDEPLPEGVAVHPSDRTGEQGREGDVASVRSWVGSLRSVGGVFTSSERRNDSGWTSWFGGRRKDTGPDLGTSFPLPRRLLCPNLRMKETTLRTLYTALTLLPSLCVVAPSQGEGRISDLEEQGAYTRAGGIDVRVPLAVFRSLVR